MLTNKNLSENLQKDLNSLRISFSSQTCEKLLNYVGLLIKWNRAYNLVGTDHPEEILTHHILDSLSIAPYIDAERIIDVGTGAGLPGIPLAILFPEKHFTLLDSVGKKIRFLTQVKAELKLANVEIIQARVEAFFSKQCFNIVVTRAFASIQEIIEKTQHLLCPDGKLLMMKGVYPEKELQGITWKAQSYPLQVPGLKKHRHLICLTR